MVEIENASIIIVMSKKATNVTFCRKITINWKSFTKFSERKVKIQMLIYWFCIWREMNYSKNLRSSFN